MDPVDLPTISYGTIDGEYARRMGAVAPEDDGPVWMVNLMRYRDRAVYADGRGADLTGREADDRYAPWGPFRTVSAQLVFLSDVQGQPVGDDHEWDRVAVVRYPTRRSFLEMQDLPEYIELHEHKDAGMEFTFVIACQPIELPDLPAGTPALDAVPHPSTEDDGPVVVLHVLKFHDGRVSEDMDLYCGPAARIALPHGVRIGAWLEVEGTVVGDGRSWDEVRFNVFPSLAAFEAVAFDPDRIAALAAHRELDVADTYTLLLRPMVDRLADSIGA